MEVAAIVKNAGHLDHAVLAAAISGGCGLCAHFARPLPIPITFPVSLLLNPMNDSRHVARWQGLASVAADELPDRLQVGRPDPSIAADNRRPEVYAGRRHYPIGEVRNVSTRNLAHRLYDLQRQRGFLENVIRLGDGGLQVRIGACRQAVFLDEVDNFRQADG